MHWGRSSEVASPPHAKLHWLQSPPVAHAGPAICWSSSSFSSPPPGIILLLLQLPSGVSFNTPPSELSCRGKEVSCVLMGCGLREQMHLLKLTNVTRKAFYCMEITSHASNKMRLSIRTGQAVGLEMWHLETWCLGLGKGGGQKGNPTGLSWSLATQETVTVSLSALWCVAISYNKKFLKTPNNLNLHSLI